MNKHYDNTGSLSQTYPTKTAKLAQSESNEDELVKSAEYKAKYTGSIATGYSTILYADEKQVDRFMAKSQLYCFFTRSQL